MVHIEYCPQLSKLRDEQFQQGIPVKGKLATDKLQPQNKLRPYHQTSLQNPALI